VKGGSLPFGPKACRSGPVRRSSRSKRGGRMHWAPPEGRRPPPLRRPEKGGMRGWKVRHPGRSTVLAMRQGMLPARHAIRQKLPIPGGGASLTHSADYPLRGNRLAGVATTAPTGSHSAGRRFRTAEFAAWKISPARPAARTSIRFSRVSEDSRVAATMCPEFGRIRGEQTRWLNTLLTLRARTSTAERLGSCLAGCLGNRRNPVYPAPQHDSRAFA
jgi:hypothetical protein